MFSNPLPSAPTGTNRIDHFTRSPLALRRYIHYAHTLKQHHNGSVLPFVQHERLHWDSVIPSGDVPFTNASDYKILYNDWPYGVEAGITHLVVWTKFGLEEEEGDDEGKGSGDLTARAREEVENFVIRTFCCGGGGAEGVGRGGEGRVAREDVVWFKNWKSLKSVHVLGEYSLTHI